MIHKSDSVILAVIDYYSDKDPELYAESLYYGGRIYSDMGDYPTALQYFQKALEQLEETAGNEELRDVAMSQTARLLLDMRLYKEAEGYLNQTIEISREKRDTVGLVMDLQLLSSVYRQMGHDKAEVIIREAVDMSKGIAEGERVGSEMLLAEFLYSIGSNDSALKIIRDLPELVYPSERDYALLCAARIYRKAGLLDTAYNYAMELVKCPYIENHRNGYALLLSPEVRGMIPKDSLDLYYDRYNDALESYYDRHESEAALLQRTLYNYGMHERKRERAERDKSHLMMWLAGAVVLILLLAILLLVLKNRSQSQRLELQEAIRKLSELNRSLAAEKMVEGKVVDVAGAPLSISNEGEPRDAGDKDADSVPTLKDLQERLRSEIYLLLDKRHCIHDVSEEILESDVYKGVKDLLENNRSFNDNNVLWEELKELVDSQSPRFNTRVEILVGKRMKPQYYRVALLMKCGFTASDIASLLCLDKSSVTYYRKKFGSSILDKSKTDVTIDDIMKAL